MKKSTAFIIVCLVVAGGIWFFYGKKINVEENNKQNTQNVEYKTSTVTISNIPYSVQVADTDKLRAQGLSGTESLENNTGMLFVFDKAGVYGFWMQDMNYSLDIIWASINSEGVGKIVHMEQNLAPETYPKVYTNVNLANIVIEVKAGEIAKNNFKIGDVVSVGTK